MTPPPPPSSRPPLPPRRGGFWASMRGFGRFLDTFRLVISNLLFFGVLLVFVTLLVMAGSGSERVVQSDSVLVIQPQGQLVEQFSIDPVQRALGGLAGDAPKQVQLRDLIKVIDAAAKDDRITRILLLPEQLRGGGFAALREVGAALDRFRAEGKPVVAWAVNLDQSQYYLAAHADRLLVDPQGGVMITGLANYRLFYKDLLDKLGVDVHLFRVGEFKSAAEPFILDHASTESKQADSYWLGGLWDEYLTEVAGMRELDPAVLRDDIDNLPEHIASTQGDLAQLALNQHLIDGVATRAQLIEMMRNEGVPAGSQGRGFRQTEFSDYLTGVSKLSDKLGAGVAVVVAEGEIVGGKQGPGVIGGESTAALVRRARENDKTKALVLRVNSPGGEVFAAEQIRREIELTRKAGIPVVVSMGNVAASGGYWISMNANRIFAEPNTITGSIGIFGMYYTVPQTLSKLGISSDGVSTGPMAGAFDITRPLDPKVGAVIQAIIDKGYRDFVGNVAQARGKTFEDTDAIAQGRVWTGRQALDRGLVDQLGGLQEAIADAAARAKLEPGYAVRYVEARGGGLQRFLSGLDESASIHLLRSWGWRLPSWVARLPEQAPELQLLRHAKPGAPNIYVDCLCAPR